MTRLLNFKQSLVIKAAIILIVGSVLYTPYQGTASFPAISLTKYLGYHPIFSPPTPLWVSSIFDYHPGTAAQNPYYYYAEVISSRVFIQFTAIVLVAFGLVILFADKKGRGLLGGKKEEANL